MRLLKYYINKQKNLEWKNKFQRVGENNYGKIFPFINTNFRRLSSIANQLHKFLPNINLNRKDWQRYEKTNEEKDKHRITRLRNSGFIESDINLLTEKGNLCLNIYDCNMSNEEKWILIFMLIINYTNQKKNNKKSMFNVANTYFEELVSLSDSKESLINEMIDVLNVNNKAQLFRKDIFWKVTFVKDKKFVKKYLISSSDEKEQLFDYVISAINPNDCIVKKYCSNSSYTVSTFKDEVEILYYLYTIINKKFNNFEEYMNFTIDLYQKYHKNINKDLIIEFILPYKKNYETIYEDLIEYQNK